ncbi:hypothetical protein [Domibacillus sp.]|uniref:hypothetical protein n=1 Tax=Domibacillus sp. TaxID=1969783 RepID=UPI002811CF4F|nr:hypothetical protein [Domibacillus sp.]
MNFLLGEKREVTIRITSRKTDPFVIRNVKYSLIKNVTGEEVAAGSGALIDKDISAVIQPTEATGHTLIFSYEIGNELLKAKVPIKVEKI